MDKGRDTKEEKMETCKEAAGDSIIRCKDMANIEEKKILHKVRTVLYTM